ncbi:hypothetical protein SAMN04488029_1533 [Reichenbachiella faecimaris]|uniref:Uncharacterized protein n=1 Tax=Reichenbachiella faecimaris TaxID=692418 RepID=A0A1W2G915_REIFA|nr:hypothetical protein [Reichenbachiella faecimaris]SMD33169.1 hypothetical protein SAMN04488029_1533 [Reichenbachiella faecimaris]
METLLQKTTIPGTYQAHADINVRFRILIELLIILLLSYGSVYGQESQTQILKNFESGSYSVYKVADKKLQPVSKPWPVQISEDASQVTVKRAGIIDEVFKPDVPGYPAYYAYKVFRLSFINDYAVYYEWNGKQQSTTKYVLVKPGGKFNGRLEEVNNEIETYAKATFKNQTNARADVKEQKQHMAEAERLANSLENKQVSKIEIKLVSQPEKVAHFSEAIRYGVVATLANGEKLSTPNLGGKIPWSDFKLTNKGCSNTAIEARVDEDADQLINDEVVLQVSSIYHTNLTAKKAISTTNDVSIKVNQNGFWGNERHKYMTVFQGIDGQHAGPADNLIIKVKTIKHAQTGASLNKIEIFNQTKNKTVARYKLTPTTNLTVNAIGGQGMNGRKGRKSETVGGNGGNGANGGQVTLLKDPSVKQLSITINNQGGRGGKGGAPYYSTGRMGNAGNSGRDGVLTTRVESVNLNF